MNTASKKTDVKQTLARGSAKMSRKLAITAARLKRAGGGVITPRKANNAAIATINPNAPRIANTPRQPSRSPMTPAMEEPTRLPARPTGKHPADRHWALIDRHEIAGESHRPRKYPARHQPRCDAHGDEQREARRQRTDQRRQCDHQQAQIHQPGLAEEVAGDAQRGLHQAKTTRATIFRTGGMGELA